jgi:hypothetical protein
MKDILGAKKYTLGYMNHNKTHFTYFETESIADQIAYEWVTVYADNENQAEQMYLKELNRIANHLKTLQPCKY